MADYDSSLPVRTETDGDVVSKIVDGAGVNIAEVNASNEQLVKDTDAETAIIAVDTTLTDKSQMVQITDGVEEVEVNPDGSINVNVVDSAVGDQIHIYGTTASGVPGTDNTVVDYTVTALKTFLLKSFQFAASGKAKGILKTGVAGADTQAVGFISTASGFSEMIFPSPIEVAAGEKIEVHVINEDKANADVYAFINGTEI